MSQPLAYFNGQFLPQSQLAIPHYDAGFIFGATVTDLARSFHHRPFRLLDHIRRFRQSCTYAQVPLLVPDEELTEIAHRLIAHNSGLLQSGQDLALVMFATPGPLNYYAGIDAEARPSLGLHTFPLPFARYLPFIREGARLVIPSIRQVPSECVDPHIKQRSRMHWWLADQEVQRTDAGAMALLLDRDGHITETASSNVAAVRNGIVVTPPRTGVLSGVSLQVVEELCGELGLRFEECPLTVNDLLACEEVFVTCTSFCLAGVSQINGTPIPWPGPTFRRLAHAWNGRAGLDIHGQILAAGQ